MTVQQLIEQLRVWRKALEAESGNDSVSAHRVKAIRARIAELERMLSAIRRNG